MLREETESFRRYKKKAKPIILDLLNKHSFLSQRSIQLILEQDNFWHTVTWNAIRDLEKEGKLRTAKYPPRGNFPTWVYKPDLRINDIKKEIDRELKPLYKEFMDASSSMGKYCEDIIEKALTKAGFITLSRGENTKYFRGRMYPKKNDLDFIAYKEGVFYGIEVKNLLAYPTWIEDVVNKMAVAEYHGIQFVLISRALGPYGYELFKCGGLHIEFDKLIWSPDFSSLAERLEERLYFPIICVDNPMEELVSRIKELPIMHDKHFYGKGRI